MSEICRYWIRLLMVAAIFIGSGLSGALAHTGAAGEAGQGHEHGRVLDDTLSLTAAGSQDHGCHGGAFAGTHCAEVHCCSAIPLTAGRFNVSLARDRYFDWGASLHYGQLSYPLLRPPIAIA
jgi:hypothetical protein